MNTSWMFFKGHDWPNAGVMLVLEFFVEGSQIAVLYDAIKANNYM